MVAVLLQERGEVGRRTVSSSILAPAAEAAIPISTEIPVEERRGSQVIAMGPEARFVPGVRDEAELATA